MKSEYVFDHTFSGVHSTDIVSSSSRVVGSETLTTISGQRYVRPQYPHEPIYGHGVRTYTDSKLSYSELVGIFKQDDMAQGTAWIKYSFEWLTFYYIDKDGATVELGKVKSGRISADYNYSVRESSFPTVGSVYDDYLLRQELEKTKVLKFAESAFVLDVNEVQGKKLLKAEVDEAYLKANIGKYIYVGAPLED